MEEKLEMWKQILVYGSIWFTWGVVMYLNQVRKKERIFKRWMFLLNAFLAWCLWISAWWALPESLWDTKYALIWIIGFLSSPILDYIEKDWINILKEKLWLKK